MTIEYTCEKTVKAFAKKHKAKINNLNRYGNKCKRSERPYAVSSCDPYNFKKVIAYI